MVWHNQQTLLKVYLHPFYNKVQEHNKINREVNLDLITDLGKEIKTKI